MSLKIKPKVKHPLGPEQALEGSECTPCPGQVLWGQGPGTAAAEVLVALEESCGTAEGIGSYWESQLCFHGGCEAPDAEM